MPLPRPARTRLYALAGYLVLALVLTWPVARDPVHRLVGHPEASAGCHAWVIWWARHHLGDFHTSLLFHPYGADVIQLYGSDLLSPLVLGRLPLPPVLLHDLWVLLLLVGGGMGVRRLAVLLGASPGGAFVGGGVFLTAPFFQHEMFNGTTELLAAAALPWFTAALVRLVRHPTPAAGAILGCWLGLGVWASAYNLFFAALIALVVGIARLFTRDPLPRGSGLGRAVAVATGTAALWGAPLAVLQVRHGAGAVYARRLDWTHPEFALPDAFADLLDWFDPRAAALPERILYPDGSVFEYWTTCTVYLGWVALVLAGVTVWKRRAPAGMLALLLVGMLVALGPYLRVGGEVMQVGGWPVQLPAATLARLFPPFAITAVHAYRYAALVVMALAVLASMAVRHPLWLLPVLVDAVLLSPLPWPAAYTDTRPGPVLEALADAPDGAVFYAGFEAEDLGDLSTMLLAQTVHGKPIHDGGIHRRAGERATTLFRDNPMVGELSLRGARRLPEAAMTRWGLEHLYDHGYRYILTRAEDSALRAWLSGALGAPRFEDVTWAGWTLEPEQPEAPVEPAAPPEPDPGEPNVPPPAEAEPEPGGSP